MRASLNDLVVRLRGARTKGAFHLVGVKLLYAVARELGHPDVRVTSIRGGPAVLGEVSILDLEAGFWGQLCETPSGSGVDSMFEIRDRRALRFLCRAATRENPYGTESPNIWVDPECLADSNFLTQLSQGLKGYRP